MRTWLKVLHKNKDIKIFMGCLGVVIAWRFGLEVMNQFLVVNMTPGTLTPPVDNHGLSRWFAWDGGWYRLITDKGYVVLNNFRGYEPVVFFPAFPLLVFMASFILPFGLIYVGSIVNVMLTALVCYFLYKLTELLATKYKVNLKYLPHLSIALVLLSPSAFFFAAYYADALLTLAFTASVYFGLKRQYVTAALFAAVASATKSIGIALVFALLIMMYVQSRQSIQEFIKGNFLKIIAVGSIASSGLIAYMGYLYIRFGDPFLFYKMQQYWDREVNGFFLKNIWEIYYRHILNPPYFGSRLGYLYHVYAMVVPIVVVFIIAYMIKRHRGEFSWLAVLTALVMFIPLSTGTILSDNRYALVLTPLVAYVTVFIYAKYRTIQNVTPVFLFFSAIGLFIMTCAFLSRRFAG